MPSADGGEEDHSMDVLIQYIGENTYTIPGWAGSATSRKIIYRLSSPISPVLARKNKLCERTKERTNFRKA